MEFLDFSSGFHSGHRFASAVRRHPPASVLRPFFGRPAVLNPRSARQESQISCSSSSRTLVSRMKVLLSLGALLLSTNPAISTPTPQAPPHDPHFFQASELSSRSADNSSVSPSAVGSSPAANCSDQSIAPGDLSACGNATLFNVWRTKIRVSPIEGWSNDPMAMYQREDGKLHVGWQCHPQVSSRVVPSSSAADSGC